MKDDFDFEIVERKPQTPMYPKEGSGADHLQHAVAENFGRIMDCACAIAESKKLLAQADAYSAKVDADCRALAAEAKVYVDKLEADTKAKVSKAEVIRRMLKDYYLYGQERLSGTDFSAVITKVIDEYNVI